MIVFILVFLYIGIAIATIVAVSRFEIITELSGDSKHTEGDAGFIMVWGILWPLFWAMWVFFSIGEICKRIIKKIMEK